MGEYKLWFQIVSANLSEDDSEEYDSEEIGGDCDNECFCVPDEEEYLILMKPNEFAIWYISVIVMGGANISYLSKNILNSTSNSGAALL